MVNRRLLGLGASFALFALLVYSTYLAVVVFGRASDNLQVAIVAGFISIISLFVGRYFEQRRELKQKIYLEKIRVYETIIDLLFSFFRLPKESLESLSAVPGEDTSGEVVERLRSAQKELLFWGSDPVIKSWMDFMAEMQRAQEMTPDRLATSMMTVREPRDFDAKRRGVSVHADQRVPHS